MLDLAPSADVTTHAAQTARLLVVDDNELNRDMLSRRLRKRGYAVDVAHDGREALAMVEHGDFDLVLLDVMMPEMNGYEVLQRLKDDPERRHIPVIMISALDEMDSIIRCIKLGAADYLPKPFNATLLRARVEASLAVKRLHDRQRAHTESLSRELEIGRQIQRGFLPSELPSAPGWDLAARFRPAREVAGDFYDAFWVDDGTGARRIALVIADVCDKGVGAALFMTLFRSLLRSTAQARPAGRTDAEHVYTTVHIVNDYIATTHGDANMFATVVLALLDPETGRLVYVNAGHDAPALVQDGAARARLEPTGSALGLLPHLPFDTAEATVAVGETIVAFTDGAADAQDAAGAFFSEARLLTQLATPAASADAVLDRTLSVLDAHTVGVTAFDDITLLAVRRGPLGHPRSARTHA
ncbi:MAG: SpoIIE family protein phosphatase [Bacteroidota bacterium]